ncbi:MAG: beta-lactamase family protein [Acidimicrobiia bacterium]|nr:beta-lactamase family protein [Acidimicrobiia bacterium]
MEGYVHPDFGAVTEKLDALTRTRRSVGGAAVAVYHRGELVVDAWTGERDATGAAWERDTMAMSFSTTKGVVATVVHRLVDRGELDYDEPVATYWPEFAAAGKHHITVRQLLTHQAGMHDVRSLVPSAEVLLDWDEMVHRLAAASPRWEPGTRPGYHGLTYGWLVGEVIRRVTGTTVNEAVQREIAEPLDIDGMYIGAPEAERTRTADLLFEPRHMRRMERAFERLQRFERVKPLIDALLVDDFLDISLSDRVLDAEIPAANGVFTARSLARMYAALAMPQHFDHPPLVSPATVQQATTVQTEARDAVVGMKMRWRLGYHLAGTTAGILPGGYGHFGFGGSGAWADPRSELAVAMVLNRVAGTPFGDTRFLRVGSAALRAAKRRGG